MSKEVDYDSIRAQLKCKNPLFLLHDDPDGLSSFLLLSRYAGKGHAALVRTNPIVDSKFLRKVEEYCPDKVFILDIAVVEQDFVDSAGVPVIWVDHHEPINLKGVVVFNPRIYDPHIYIPATYLCYRAVMQDLWIAMVGCIGDWFFPDFSKEFSAQYPDLMDKSISNADDAMFRSKVGTLVRVFSFVLKGKLSDAVKSAKVLMKVKSPYDILMQRTPEGRFLYRRYDYFNSQYQKLLSAAVLRMGENGLCVFTYSAQTSFSSDLANELLYMHPDSFVIVGREKDDEVKMSLRSRKTAVLPKLKKALEGVEGYGGGHEYACGACVKKKDFDRFVEKLRKLL